MGWMLSVWWYRTYWRSVVDAVFLFIVSHRSAFVVTAVMVVMAAVLVPVVAVTFVVAVVRLCLYHSSLRSVWVSGMTIVSAYYICVICHPLPPSESEPIIKKGKVTWKDMKSTKLRTSAQ